MCAIACRFFVFFRYFGRKEGRKNYDMACRGGGLRAEDICIFTAKSISLQWKNVRKKVTQKTEAIVLSLRKCADNVSVAQLYTAQNGRMAFAVRGNKYKGMLSPLSRIEVTATHRGNNSMGTLTSVALVRPHTRLATDVKRQCIAMFIAEILSLTVRHPMQDEELFAWLCGVVEELDACENVENIHLRFLIDYTMFLGIGVDEAEHPEWFLEPTSRQQRQQFLKEICAYYAEHIEEFSKPKSLNVLMEVFD